MKKILFLSFISLFCFASIADAKPKKKETAPEKRNFTFTDAMHFDVLRSPKLSNDASFFAFEARQDRGDGKMHVYSTTDTSKRYVVENGRRATFSDDAKWVAMTIEPTEAEKENAKSKGDKLPNNKLKLINLQTDEEFDMDDMTGYKFSDDSRWLVYKTKLADKPKMEKYKKKSLGSPMKLRHLASNSEIGIDWVSDYDIDSLGNYLFYAISSPDGKRDGIYCRELRKDFAPERKLMSLENAAFDNVVWNFKHNILVFTLATLTEKGRTNDCALLIGNVADGKLNIVNAYYPTDTTIFADTIRAKFAGYTATPEKWYIPQKNSIRWNETKDLLYFGVKPDWERYDPDKEVIKMTDSNMYNVDTLLEKADVYVWGWDDPLIITQQQYQWKTEKDRTYATIYNVATHKYMQIGDTTIPVVSTTRNNDYTLAFSDKPYRKEQTWYGDCEDMYVVNLNNGEKTKVGTRIEESTHMSQNGHYVLYYKDLHWHLYDCRTGNTTNVTQNVPTRFDDVKMDIPTTPYSNGFGGFVDDDKGFFLYDNWDIWYFDASNPSSYRNITQGKGKANRVVYRLRRVDAKVNYFQSSDTMIVTAFSQATKDAGIYNFLFNPDRLEERIPMAPHFFRNVMKAKDNNKICFAREKYNEFPNYYLTNYSFTEPQRLSDLNLHILDTFNWGHTKLFEWKYRDSTNQGYLVLPDNYDSTKAYPVFVYFYDQMSDRMNRFYMPELTHRPVNQIYMDNYIMFFPDITYIIGRPGDDAVDCILSGCRALAAQGIIDTNRSCVQGHSWGGYQTAYIAAKPTFFSAACAGAPVGNMTSAYSGIRLGSGRTRQFQYETQQSRIGGNIFDSLDAYIRNSPIFTANQATTPLLIGHGDVDEAVPYQQGVELYMAFRRAQKPCWLLQYVNEPHWQERYWNKVDYSVKMKEFFDHYCLGKPEPEWMKGRPYKGEVNGK